MSKEDLPPFQEKRLQKRKYREHSAIGAQKKKKGRRNGRNWANGADRGSAGTSNSRGGAGRVGDRGGDRGGRGFSHTTNADGPRVKGIGVGGAKADG